MKIELKDNYPNHPILIINGNIVDEKDFEIDDLILDDNFGLSINIIGVKKNNCLLENNLFDFPLINNLRIIEDNPVSFTFHNINWISKYTITFERKIKTFNQNDNLFFAELEFQLDSKYFKENLSYAQYQSLLEQIGIFTKNSEEVEIKNFYMSYEGGILGATLLFKNISTTVSLNFEIRRIVSFLLEIIKYSELAYNENSINTIITSYYDFPNEIKVFCKQYLEYFALFLQDLGINATSNLKEEAGKVLFSVTPTDDKVALETIQKALAVYLNLPASPIVYDDSFAAMRLQQQIENLQHSQRMAVREIQANEKLLVAQSGMIHEKNITISQQQSVIEQQQKIIEKISSKSIMMDSVENKEELEEIYDGLKIGESKFLKEQLGIHLNPAKVIKTAVKNTFGKQDENESVLGLDEEDEN